MVVEQESERQADWRQDAMVAAAFGVVLAAGLRFGLWSPQALVIAFWFETALVGMRYLVMTGVAIAEKRGPAPQGVFQAFFFTIHYGVFCAGTLAMAAGSILVSGPNAPAQNADGSYSFELEEMFAGVGTIISENLLVFLVIAAWQGLELRRFFVRDEMEIMTPSRLAGTPYLRLLLQHWPLLFVAAGLLELRTPPADFAVLILYKSGFDIAVIAWSARKNWAPWEHKRAERQTSWATQGVPKGVVFDAATAPLQGKLFIIVGALFTLIGLLVVATDGGKWFFGFSLLFTVFVTWSIVTTRRKFQRALASGACPQVEGIVEQYVTEDLGKRGIQESFKVRGLLFSYGATIHGGFRKTANNGGPMREGLRVRIHYLTMPEKPSQWQPQQNVILRLEIL